MKPNDERKLTFDEKVELLLKSFTPLPRPKLAPKPAAQRAEERWAVQKPIEAVIRDEAAHNETLIERLRTEQEEARRAEQHRGYYQGLIDSVWQSQLDCQAQLAELRPSFHRGPGDPDW
jgi:hypothetical protein